MSRLWLQLLAGAGCSAALITLGVASAEAQDFDFDDGTIQGWTLEGAFVDTVGGPFASNFTLSWEDSVSYPNPSGQDPLGDNAGSLNLETVGGHGIAEAGTWWTMRLRSPSLRCVDEWQTADGFTVRLSESMSVDRSVQANLVVRLFDIEQQSERFVVNGPAQVLTPDVFGDPVAVWDSLTFDFTSIPQFPARYIVEDVVVNVWGELVGTYDGRVFVDEVVPFGGTPSVAELLLVPGEWPDLLSAVGAACSGDSIEIADGAYSGPGFQNVGFLGKTLHIRSASGDPSLCTIDAGGSSNDGLILTASAGTSTVTGLTIENARAGVRTIGAPVTVDRCVFRNSRFGATANSGAILTLVRSTVADNQNRGLVASLGNVVMVLDSCQVTGNAGGGVSITEGSLTITNSLITGNVANQGAGILVADGFSGAGTALVQGSTVSGNRTLTGDGGGVLVLADANGASADIRRSIVWGNCAFTGSQADEVWLSEGGGGGSALVDLTCCVVDTAGVGGVGTINQNDVVDGSPLFCGALACEDAPSSAGDYTVRADSPCLPGASPCGQLIGARGQGCACDADGTLRVPSEYVSIQAAVDFACDGDTVVVDSTAYDLDPEDVVVAGKTIGLRALDGRVSMLSLTWDSPDATPTGGYLQGFSITGDFTTTGDLDLPFTMDDCTISGTTRIATNPAGAFTPELTVTACVFQDTAWVAQSNLLAAGLISGCRFENAPLMSLGETAFIEDCTATGGDLQVSGQVITVTGCTVSGGGIQVAVDSQTATVDSCTVTGGGTGILVTVNAASASVEDNQVSGCLGAGIRMTAPLTSNSSVLRNTVLDCGDGIVTTGDNLEIRTNIVSRCGDGVDTNGAGLDVRSNTVVSCTGTGIRFATGPAFGSCRHNLVALNDVGIVAPVGTPGAALENNDVWGNTTANWSGVADQTGANCNISQDPLLCDAAGDDYGLAVASPCRPENHPGCPTLIGAVATACPEVLVDAGDGVTVSETGPTTDSYTITLATAPAGSVQVVVAWDSNQVSVAPDSVVLNLSNWQTGVAVDVTAVDDSLDEVGDHVTGLTHAIGAATSDPLYAALTDLPGVGVTIADNDTSEVIADVGDGVNVSEAGPTSDSYIIALATEPVGDVQIDVGWDPGEVDIAPPTIFLDATNWRTGVSIDVTAVDDGEAEGGHQTILSHAIGVGTTDTLYAELTDLPQVTVSIADDDTASVLVDIDDGVAVSEAGTTSDAYIVTLATPPAGVVEVAVTWDSTQVSVSPPSVILDNTNWQTGVAVGVTAVDDPIDEGGDHLTTLSHAIGPGTTDPLYAPLTDLPEFGVTIADDDTAGVVVAVGDGVSVSEDGETSDGYTITLATQPVGDVQVDVTWDPAQVGATPTSVVLDSTNWDTGIAVSVTAVDDAIDEGEDHGTDVTHAVGVGTTDPIYAALTDLPLVPVTIADDDTAAVLVAEGDGVLLSETGPTSDTYTISLATEPTGDVEIDLSWDSAQVDPVPVTVVLNPTNWQTGIAVDVTAVDDPFDEGGDHLTDLTHAMGVGTLDPIYAALTGLPSVTATVADNDTTAIIADAGDGVSVSEAGVADAYTIRLATQPAGDVEVTVSWDTDQVDVSSSSVVLDSTNWSTGVALDVSAVDDDEAEGAHASLLTHALGPATTDALYGALTGFPEVTVAIADDDSAGVFVNTGTGVLISEEGPTSDAYVITLTTEPVGDVEVTVSWDDAQMDADRSSVILDPTNWQDGVIVRVTAVDDPLDEGGDHTSSITHAIGGATTDPVYAGLIDLPGVSVLSEDNDDAAVEVDVANGVSVFEAGPTTDRYTLRLATAPTAVVEVDISWDPAQVDVTPSSVQLNPTNWQTGVDVDVTAVDDAVAEGPHQATLTHAIGAGTTDPVYGSLTTLPEVTVDITDDDDASVLVDVVDGVAVSESGPTSDTYIVRLGTLPEGVVEVAMTWTAAQIDVDPPSVILDATNWDTGVPVDVTAVDDAAVEGNHQTDIGHIIGAQTTDPIYAALGVLPDVTVDITDNDAAPNCAITVTTPGSDTSWENGEVRTITWQSTNCGGEVELGLYAQSADVPCQRVTTSDTGSYDWFVFGCGEGAGSYRLRVTDTVSGISDDSPLFQIVPTPVESMTLVVPTIPRSAYELWSVPMDLEGQEVPDDSRLSDLLGEVFGRNPSSSTWRGFALVDSLVSDPPLETGRGYWVNSTIPIPADYDVTGGGTQAVSLPLATGWNTVGTPSDEPIPLSSLRVRTAAGDAMTLDEAAEGSVISGVIWDYVDESGDLVNNGRWESTNVTTDADLIPWTAVLVRAFEPAELLFGSPDIPPVARREPLFEPLSWSMVIGVRSGTLRDEGVEVGAAPGALPDFDVLDLPKPPLPGGGLELSVLHEEWGRFSGRYVRSVGSSEGETHRWSIELRGGDEEAQLSWSGVESIPDGLYSYLVLPGGAAVPMADQATFTTPVGGSAVFDVLVSSDPWTGPLVTSGFNGVLGIAPRPFYGDRMRITYQIATGPVEARLRLFDVRGRLVRDFGRIEGAVGTWVQPWDGRTDTGLAVGSGMYFFELRLGTERHTIRQVVVR